MGKEVQGKEFNNEEGIKVSIENNDIDSMV